MKVELILLKTEDEYRKEYMTTYIQSNLCLGDIPVVLSEGDFDHIFYEPASGANKYKFSYRRAKRMYFLKAILSGEIDVKIMFQPDRQTIALFCVDLECVMYLRIRPKSGTLQVGTFFDFGTDHTRMYNKQKKKCVPITIEEVKEKIQ